MIGLIPEAGDTGLLLRLLGDQLALSEDAAMLCSASLNAASRLLAGCNRGYIGLTGTRSGVLSVAI